MIIESLLTIVRLLLTFMFNLLPTIPNLPSNLYTAITSTFNTIFQNCSLLGLFVHIETLKVLFPILITVILFDKVITLAMFIIKKIPMIDIK